MGNLSLYHKRDKSVLKGNTFKRLDKRRAYENGGYRERYAMENGNMQVKTINRRTYWKFTYSKWDEYQDANGALYDVKAERRVN